MMSLVSSDPLSETIPAPEAASLADRLREERKRLALSQTAFAAIGGVCKNSQINYEAGRTAPDSNYLVGVAEAGVDVLYILTGERSVARHQTLSPDLRSTPTAASAPVEREPASPRFSSLLGAGWRWLVMLNRRIEDSWVGDLLACAGLIIAFVLGLFVAGALQ